MTTTDNKTNLLLELFLFTRSLEKIKSKKELAILVTEIIQKVLGAKFISFVEKANDSLKVVYQSGDSSTVLSIFSQKSSENIFEWVINQEKYVLLSLAQKEQFMFIPVLNKESNDNIIYGLIVVNLDNVSFVITEEIDFFLGAFSTLISLTFFKILNKINTDKNSELTSKIESELKLISNLQKSFSDVLPTKKLLISVLEDEKSTFNGNVWWLGSLGADITLILFAQILSKGMPASLLGGFLLGEMNILKTNADISLHPKAVLKYLNQQLNTVFKNTGIAFNAWFGVFNLGARKVRFANANHPDPFLIGSEQQVSSLSAPVKGLSLGINLDSNYEEFDSYIAPGSKLVICTGELLERASKLGNKYDPQWLPQVLETIGALPLHEMKNSLNNILSESINGTTQDSSRLALLLEVV